MGIRTKIFLGVVLALAPAFWFLVHWVLDDLTPQYRESTEEPLVDTAYVLANIAAATVEDGQVDVALFREALRQAGQEKIEARIYNFTKSFVDLRVYITDRAGIVVFDSWGGAAEGEDFSGWRDVRLTLDGSYGARTSRDLPLQPRSSIMYVAAPIRYQGELIGVLSVGKPTNNANQFVEQATREITYVGLLSAASAVLVALFISGLITRPIRRLEDYAAAIRDGKRVTIPPVSGPELRSLAQTFESMRDTLEGKKYVEQYVQTLTHEIKGPLAAIQGASELLAESPPPTRQTQFLYNIQGEAKRIQDIIDSLLQLSQVEAKKHLEDKQRIALSELVSETIESFQSLAEQKGVEVSVASSAALYCLGDKFLLRQTVANLLKNAIEFSPRGGTVRCRLYEEARQAVFEVSDDGPGVPAYAQNRVFERFYSLQRPDSGRKSSGLGLSLAQEVAAMHHGRVTLENEEKRGARARLFVPTV